MSSYSRQQLEAWLKTIEIPNSSKVLDVGGSQNPILGRIKIKGNDVPFEYKILDLKVPHECKQDPDMCHDMNYKLGGNERVTVKYDVIFAIEIMEYIYNPLQALLNMKNKLEEGGLLYISFHFIYPVHNPIEQDYLRYTRNGAIKLLQEAGFEIEEIKPRYLRRTPLLFFANERMRGVKGIKDSHIHEEQGCLIKAKKI